MTKDDIILALVRKVGLSKRQAGESLIVVLDEIVKALSNGKEVKLTGFGKFLVKERKMGTGTIKVLKFKAGQILKDAVR